MTATVYVIWERVSRSMAGGAQPLVFTNSAHAQAHADKMLSRSSHEVNPPKPVYDVVAVLV